MCFACRRRFFPPLHSQASLNGVNANGVVHMVSGSLTQDALARMHRCILVDRRALATRLCLSPLGLMHLVLSLFIPFL